MGDGSEWLRVAKSREQRKSLGPALLCWFWAFFQCNAMPSLLGSSLVSVTSWEQRIKYKKMKFSEAREAKSSGPVLSLLMGNEELAEMCLARTCEMGKLEKK